MALRALAKRGDPYGPFDVRLQKAFAQRAKRLSQVWKSEVKRNTTGPILKVRSGKLNRNIFIKRKGGYPKPSIEVGTRASNPRDGFPYAAWHEFGNVRKQPKENILQRLATQYRNKLKGKGAGGTGRAYLLHGLDRALQTTEWRGFYPQVRREAAAKIRASFIP